jgi:hypothetical protein
MKFNKNLKFPQKILKSTTLNLLTLQVLYAYSIYLPYSNNSSNVSDQALSHEKTHDNQSFFFEADLSHLDQLDLKEQEIGMSDQISHDRKRNTQQSEIKNKQEASVIKFKKKTRSNAENFEDTSYSNIKLDSKSKNLHFEQLSRKIIIVITR